MDPKKIPSARELQLLALVVKETIGREVAKVFEKETGKRIPYGTVYSLLDAMAEAGWVSSREEMRNGRRIRLFRIKGAGAKALNRGRDHYHGLANFGLGAKGRLA